MKRVYIAEKPSVAQAFAKALSINGKRSDGYIESDEAIVTWCVGHLVSMSYPEAYDESLKKWNLSTIPFLPDSFRYEVIDSVKKQFRVVSAILNRDDVDTIYVCTDAGREGEYIYRLVEMQAQVKGKMRKRVWIDSQTDEEIKRGVREAKDLAEYDNLSAAAFLRAKEDYLMGINFSRAMTLRYANPIKNYLKTDKCVIAIGRVMTCVLGMVVDREREIRSFVKTPFYGVEGQFLLSGAAAHADTENAPADADNAASFAAAWKATEKSRYHESPLLYNEKGFREKKDAEALIAALQGAKGDAAGDDKQEITAVVEKAEKKTEKKNAPMLYNLAELQNDCSRFFKISPDQTLQIAQELYEKKLTTYPRTDARVLSGAVAKEIGRNIKGLTEWGPVAVFAKAILQHGTEKTIHKTRYVNDKAVTDHYAIIPTGQEIAAVERLSPLSRAVYELITRRFLAIFYPPAVYEKLAVTISVNNQNDEYTEHFYTNFRLLKQKGYLHVLERAGKDSLPAGEDEERNKGSGNTKKDVPENEENKVDEAMMESLKKLRKGSKLKLHTLSVKEGETTPPKRYNSGSLILAMENAGQLIEDPELRAQIKGAGIGTSATRAEILKKLAGNRYLQLNKKTQIVTPTQLGEMIYEAVLCAMKPMLSPTLTASWEKGLAGVSEGTVSEEEYMEKLTEFVRRRVETVKSRDMSAALRVRFDAIAPYYAGAASKGRARRGKKAEKEKGEGKE